MPRPEVSVVVVNYKAHAHVERLRKSFAGSDDIELIVIDHSHVNRGYSEGINSGVRASHAPFVVCCNPDIELTPESVRKLVLPLQHHPKIGLVGPQILNEQKKLERTCSAVPGPFLGLIEFSFLRTVPGFSRIARAYRLHGFDHMSSCVVPSVNGSCFAMRRTDFEQLGGLDQGYFLYFEEFDLAKSLQQLGKQVFFSADVSVVHHGQESTKHVSVQRYFLRSRRRFFQKWYGIVGKGVVRLLEMFAHVSWQGQGKEKVAVAALVREQDAPREAFMASVAPADAVYLVSDGPSQTWKHVAQEQGWKYMEHPLEGNFATQRNAVLEMVQEPWTVFLDTDEELSQEWWQEFRGVLSDESLEAVVCRRHDLFHKQVLQHGEVGAQRLVRAARTATSRQAWKRSVHEVWELPYHQKYTMRKAILHSAHASISEFWKDLTAYVFQEPLPSPVPSSLRIVVLLLLLPGGKFLQNYFLRSGWRDGWAGLTYATVMSMYSLMKRVVWYEARTRQ